MAIFVKFDGIDGECQLKGLTRFSEVESFEIGAEKTVEGTTGQARRRGDVKLGDVTITKILDSTAPSMFLVTAKSHIFPYVIVIFTESFADRVDSASSPTGTRNVLLEVVMEDVLTSNYSISGSGDDPPTETVILNYTRITYRYRLVNKSGAVNRTVVSSAAAGAEVRDSAVVVGGWDSEISKEYVSTLRTGYV